MFVMYELPPTWFGGSFDIFCLIGRGLFRLIITPKIPYRIKFKVNNPSGKGCVSCCFKGSSFAFESLDSEGIYTMISFEGVRANRAKTLTITALQVETEAFSV
jgi:hypothetical protein